MPRPATFAPSSTRSAAVPPPPGAVRAAEHFTHCGRRRSGHSRRSTARQTANRGDLVSRTLDADNSAGAPQLASLPWVAEQSMAL